MPANCPYCGGKLVTAPASTFWDYDCLKCGRAWSVMLPEKVWVAHFDAANTVYSAEKAKERLRAMRL